MRWKKRILNAISVYLIFFLILFQFSLYINDFYRDYRIGFINKADSNYIPINKLNIENITIQFKHESLNIVLLTQNVNSNASSITVFKLMILVLGEIENIDYYSSPMGVFVRGVKINNTWYRQTTEQFWIYKVNGVLAGVSCSLYYLKSNDSVVWYYTNSYQNTDNPKEDYLDDFIIILSILLVLIGGLVILGLVLKKISRKVKVI